MPFYEYECAHCKFYKEVMQKVSDAPLKKCPSCGRSALKKLVSAPVFRLKGAGWYETDFKSDKEQKRNLADKEPDKKEAGDVKDAGKDAGKEAKTEAKPAEKAAEGGAKDAKPADSKPAAESKSAAANGGQRRGTKSARKSAAKASVKAKPAVRKKRR
jgi:putative FmdB family regulatory protein